MVVQSEDFKWKKILVMAFVPALVYAIGVGSLVPVIPLVAIKIAQETIADQSLVLSLGTIIISFLMIGELIGYIPSSWLVSKVGEKNAMLYAASLSTLGILIVILLPSIIFLGIGVLLIGCSTAVFGLARHSFVTVYVPFAYRARVLSIVAGLFRLGYFVGPLLTALFLSWFKTLESAYFIHIAMCLLAVVVLLLATEPEVFVERKRSYGSTDLQRAELQKAKKKGIIHTFVARRNVLLTIGGGAAIISALRAGRIAIPPIWAVSIGMDEITTTLIISVAAGIDFLFFYTGGWIIDKFGRLWNAVPSTLGLSIFFILLAITPNFSNPVFWFWVVMILLSISNGIGTGILLTLGSDLADIKDPSSFLGAWRFTGGIGTAIAPVFISAVTAVTSLPLAVALLGLSGFAGVTLLMKFVPKYVNEKN